MKAVLIVDVNDDTYLEPEADVIIDNGDFHLETKAFLKPMPSRMEVDYDTISSCEVTEKVVAIGWNACVDAIVGEEENE